MSVPYRKFPEELPGLTLHRRTTSSVSSRAAKTTLFAFAALAIMFFTRCAHRQLWHGIQSTSLDTTGVNLCPQAPELIPVKNNALWETLTEIYGTEAFRLKAVDWLSGAVQIPTNNPKALNRMTKWIPVGVDPRWEKFSVFHDYLAKAFPLVHATLQLTKVNTYGLIYVWRGSDTTLKPLLLTATKMLCPWNQPPMIHGPILLSRVILTVRYQIYLYTLVHTVYRQPDLGTRQHGRQEWINWHPGAQTLASKLLEMFGENGYAMLVDEGGGYGEQHGRVIATPAIAEKGKANVMIEVTTPGGHSSLPPPHTSIGLLAAFLVAFERNPFDAHLTRGSPVYKNYQCVARYAPDLPDSLRKDIIDAEYSDKALRSAEEELFRDARIKNLVGTTQAIDLVAGGVKVNALPERAYAVINHRISVESSVAATLNHDASLIEPLAKEYNLSYTAFDDHMDGDMKPSGPGKVMLSTVFEARLEPAPITPTEEGAGPYQVLSGSIKTAYNSHRGISGDDHIIVSPGIMSGNTDTKFYWKLTPHIFRYGHTAGVAGGVAPPGIHTVNEAIAASSFVEMIRFFTTLILNVDESPLV
ncbi:hypothetical protein JVT61DRAFT_5945 [Boletus reticuloceps]|uniref:Peptidase M20 dimerisation domain-containing protein n=1 Tax=Boletus reticuloceps TaxID=495285 RepID=A0A8I2YL36_9AGAM|nr:hypothetical protein JVT61DRAFT_5945 [Boletus reticuloceps]